MVGIAVNFELGRYHATAWGSHVNSAELDWPPSPWRLLRAIYATARSNVAAGPDWDTTSRALEALCRCPPPAYVVPEALANHTRHYFPARDHSAAKHSTDKVIDAFLAVDPAAELEVWWDAELGEDERDGLGATLQRVGYLGRSESLCRMRLIVDRSGIDASRAGAVPADRAAAAEGRLVDLLCADPGASEPVELLGESVSEIRRRRSRLPAGALHVPYRVRAVEPVAGPGRPAELGTELVRYRIADTRRPSLREAATVCAHLRRAVQGRYGELYNGSSSSVFSGKNPADLRRLDGHRHAHFLALPDSDGRRVEHLVVWAPEGLGQRELAALTAVDHLRLRDRAKLRLVLTNLGRCEEMRLPDLLGPSPRWRSVTPFALVRHPKRRGGAIRDAPEAQVQAELESRGIAAAVTDLRPLKGSWSKFTRTRPGGKLASAPGAFGFELAFDQPVRGPLALGALSHFGLGLFLAED